MKFYASVRLDVRRVASIKEGDVVVGSRTKVKVVKNKLAPPFRIIEFDLIHGEGISTEGELIDLGMEKELISRRGTWYSYGDRQIGQGKENARKFLLENADVATELETRLRELYELPVLSGKEEEE